MTLGPYRKALTALVGGVISWAGPCWVPDGHVTRAEWYLLAVALAYAAGVWAVPNDRLPGRPGVDPGEPLEHLELTKTGPVPLKQPRAARGRPGPGEFEGLPDIAATRTSGE